MRRPELALVAVCSGWGTIPLLVREVDLPAEAITFGRVSIAAAGLGLALLVRRGRETSRPAPFTFRPVLSAATGAVLAAHWFAMFAAYQRAPSSTVILIVFLAPVGIAALAPAVLRERHTRRTLVALGVGVAGLALVVVPAVEGRASPSGLAFAGVSAAFFVALVLMSKPLSEAYGGVRTAFVEMTGASVCLLPVALTTAWGDPRAAWGWLVVLGLVHTAAGTGVYLAALGRVPATHVGILGYLEPASVVVLGWLVLDESPAAATLAGGALIVLAGWLTVTDERRADVPG